MKSSPPDPDTATLDSSLLARFVRERDEDAFGQLVGRYERVVMGAALRRTGNVEIARDVAQQVFVTLAKKAGSLVGHGCLGGWMYRTASFEALRFMKSERRRRERESAWTGDDEESGQADPAKWEALEEALARMPGAKRDLIVGGWRMINAHERDQNDHECPDHRIRGDDKQNRENEEAAGDPAPLLHKQRVDNVTTIELADRQHVESRNQQPYPRSHQI